MPSAGDRFEAVLDADQPGELGFLALGPRVLAITEKLPGRIARGARLGQGDLRIDAQGEGSLWRRSGYFKRQYLAPRGVTSRYIPWPSVKRLRALS